MVHQDKIPADFFLGGSLPPSLLKHPGHCSGVIMA